MATAQSVTGLTCEMCLKGVSLKFQKVSACYLEPFEDGGGKTGGAYFAPPPSKIGLKAVTDGPRDLHFSPAHDT